MFYPCQKHIPSTENRSQPRSPTITAENQFNLFGVLVSPMYNLLCIIKCHMERAIDLRSKSCDFHIIRKNTESMKPYMGTAQR